MSTAAAPEEQPTAVAPSPDTPARWRSGVRGFVVEWGSLALCIVVLTVGLRLVIAQAFYIPSGSMLPQLQIDDRIVVSKLAYRLHDPRRGDIVVFDAPASMAGPQQDQERSLPSRIARGLLENVNIVKPSKTEYVKRVIGLPGDRLEARNGNVYVNGSLLVEPYLQPGVRTTNLEGVTVQEGRLFVMGDNRGGSSDSRVFGSIPRSTVVGRAVVKIWPVGSASWL